MMTGTWVGSTMGEGQAGGEQEQPHPVLGALGGTGHTAGWANITIKDFITDLCTMLYVLPTTYTSKQARTKKDKQN